MSSDGSCPELHAIFQIIEFLFELYDDMRCGVSIYSFLAIFCFSFLAIHCSLCFYPRNRNQGPQESLQVQQKIPSETALLESEPDFNSGNNLRAGHHVITIQAHFIDFIDNVGDVDTDTHYINGPFLKSWFDLGSIKEILEMLWPDNEHMLDPVSMENLFSLLERAYSRPEDKPDPPYQDRAYKRHEFFIENMKKVTYGNRLFKTARLSRLGVGPPNIQKGDSIFFVPQDSFFLVVRTFSPKCHHNSDPQLHYRLVGKLYTGINVPWSKKQPNLATLPLQTLFLKRKEGSKWTEENYNESTESTHVPNQKSTIKLDSNYIGSNAIEESKNPKVGAYRAREALQRHCLESSSTTTQWSIISKIEAYQGTERLTVSGAGSSRYMMFWKCTCGYIGFDHYTELWPGAVHELLKAFHRHGVKAFIEACGPPKPNPTYLNIVRFEIFITNLYTWLRVCIFAWLQRKEWSHSVAVEHDRNSDSVGDSSPSFKTAAGPKNGGSSSSQNTDANILNVNQQVHVATGSATTTSATPAQSNQPSPSPVTYIQGKAATINIREDFILLCMKVKRFLTARHDLQVSTMTRDHELFQAFRREYRSKFGWAYRQFSLQTIQRINFVKFALHPRYEVDGIKPDMPPETARHYTFDPRKPGQEPALGNDFLMHRFNSPIECYQDDICLRQFPKRVGERPTPGIDPDFDTGWGMHLEQDLDLERIFLVLFFGIASAGTFGLVWGVCKSMQDGFAVASFIAGSEAVAVAVVQILLSVGAI